MIVSIVTKTTTKLPGFAPPQNLTLTPPSSPMRVTWLEIPFSFHVSLAHNPNPCSSETHSPFSINQSLGISRKNQFQTQRPFTTLYCGWAESGIYTWSPFVIKLELLLRISSLTYLISAGNSRNALTGKIPYISLASKPNPSSPPPQIRDPSLIAKHLISTDLKKDLNTNLDETSKALDLAIQGTV